jgi:1-deoxy-D-xylulose-5-phosphate reductoisomerase
MRGVKGDRRGIAVLGSTGSIGRQTLDAIAAHSDRFRVVALAARTPSRGFLAQIARHRPLVSAVSEPGKTPGDLEPPLLVGPDGLAAAATHPEVDFVVVATSGHAAIIPTIQAIEHGKTIALANKETLVCAGALIMPLARARGVEIRPVDSEHSAIWQALGQTPLEQVRRVILTASGGPFRTLAPDQLTRVTVQDALAHPTWSMGGKITIDSATLMNKGLEIIEAHWLFGIPYDQIDVLIHPESIVHSLVEFVDGGQIAQLGQPDMRLPILYALTYPERVASPAPRLHLAETGALRFAPPDEHRFPALRVAREAGLAGSTYPTVLSAADEIAVEAFLRGEIEFMDIPAIVEHVLGRHDAVGQVTLEAITAADDWARTAAHTAIADRGAGRGR